MITLGIDTAGPAAAVALWQGSAGAGEVLVSKSAPMARGHAEAIMPMVSAAIAEALGEGHKSFTAIDRVAVLNGPGSFTGVRIGVAAARGLALAMGCPAVSVTAFTAAAAVYCQSHTVEGPFAIAFDAKRDQVYLQNFTAGGDPLSAPAAVDLDTIAERVAPDAVVVLGSGSGFVLKSLAAAGRHLAAGDDTRRGADIVARLGADLEAEDAPLPLYLRPPDAKPQRPALARAGG